jgi:hypothetical protein
MIDIAEHLMPDNGDCDYYKLERHLKYNNSLPLSITIYFRQVISVKAF